MTTIEEVHKYLRGEIELIDLFNNTPQMVANFKKERLNLLLDEAKNKLLNSTPIEPGYFSQDDMNTSELIFNYGRILMNILRNKLILKDNQFYIEEVLEHHHRLLEYSIPILDYKFTPKKHTYNVGSDITIETYRSLVYNTIEEVEYLLVCIKQQLESKGFI